MEITVNLTETEHGMVVDAAAQAHVPLKAWCAAALTLHAARYGVPVTDDDVERAAALRP